MEDLKRVRAKKHKKSFNPVYLEILKLIFLAACVILTLSVWLPEGTLGQELSKTMTDWVGIGALPMSLLLLCYAWRKLLVRKRPPKDRAFWCSLAFTCFVSIAHVLYLNATDRESPVSPGGALGTIVGGVVYEATGFIGSMFLLCVGLIVFVILFTGQSLTATITWVWDKIAAFFVYIVYLFNEARDTRETTIRNAPGREIARTAPHVTAARLPAIPPKRDALPAYKPKYEYEVKDRPLDFVAINGAKRKTRVKTKALRLMPTADGDAGPRQPIMVHGLVEETPVSDSAVTLKRRRGADYVNQLEIAEPLSAAPIDTIATEINNYDMDRYNAPRQGAAHYDGLRADSSHVDVSRMDAPQRAGNPVRDDLSVGSLGSVESVDGAPQLSLLQTVEDDNDNMPFSSFSISSEVKPSTGKIAQTGGKTFYDEWIDDLLSEEQRVEDVLEVEELPPRISHISQSSLKSMSIKDGVDEATIYKNYELPDLIMLNYNANMGTTESRKQILENSRKLEETLRSFRVEAKVVEVSVGPTVTRYEMAPGQGVKVSSIASLSNDLALSLAAHGIRIEAPIPGKSAVGIEIPNKDPQPVLLREILEDDTFRRHPSKVAFAVGKDISGATVVADISKMPHLLIAGATGSGKSVCINTIIASILYKAKPNEVKLLMIDPKVVELSVYNDIPHLLMPVITDCKKASVALTWAVAEMDIRYNLFAMANVRDLKSYNDLKSQHGESDVLPQIVIIVDELADLMMVAKGEIEELICRLAQKARAAGLHLILATQRPSVDVITGLIKANIPSRMAFAVSSGTDSRTVLDMTGAEKLLGKGDMLFLPAGRAKPVRVQCGFISDNEVENLVEFLKEQKPISLDNDNNDLINEMNRMEIGDTDEFFEEAAEFLISQGKASTSILQRQFRIGYNRASRLMEELEKHGVVGPGDGARPRKVLVGMEQWRAMR
ncbi:MAG: DNA translocase FtsK [Clostridiales bacterium]|nr:DNA translocase FtsK [Clostridiales bacterium]